MLSRLFRRGENRARAHTLYAAAVAQARLPAFYRAGQVPDTLDGRFEMIALHGFLVLHRLKGAPAPGPAIAQAFFDTMFGDMDRSLREMGVGDLGVGRRVKAMAKGFYGRIAAYEAGLAAADDAALADALRRNVYGTLRDGSAVAADTLAALARYVRFAAADLAGQETGEILAGRVRFPAPDAVLGRH